MEYISLNIGTDIIAALDIMLDPSKTSRNYGNIQVSPEQLARIRLEILRARAAVRIATGVLKLTEEEVSALLGHGPRDPKELARANTMNAFNI
jgi:hypothetical protein